METATEIAVRLAEYNKRYGHLYERMRKAWPLRLPAVTCIKYGRRKPRRRVYGYTHVGLLTGKGWQAPDVKISIH